MHTSSLVVETAQQLAAAGHHAEVVAYLRARRRHELEDSPSLALLYGTERAGGRQGVAECYYNLAITYRLQAMPDRALAEAERAVGAAEVAGDETLRALALRGRAEIHVVRGELEPARRDLDEVGEIRSGLADPVGEAEDLRIGAAVRAAEGDVPAADRALREVIRRAEQQGRPHLLAGA